MYFNPSHRRIIILNLKNIFDQIGKAYVAELMALIRRQKGIDGIGYVQPVKVKAHTTKGHTRYSKYGKPYKVGEHRRESFLRLVNTNQYNQNAFIHQADNQTLVIQGNPAIHPDGISFNDITAYNDKGSPDLIGKHGAAIRRNGPKIFPRTEPEFFLTEVGKVFPQLIADEVKSQVENEMEKSLTKEIRIIIGS